MTNHAEESLQEQLDEARRELQKVMWRGEHLWRTMENDQTWWQQNATGWYEMCQEAWKQRDGAIRSAEFEANESKLVEAQLQEARRERDEVQGALELEQSRFRGLLDAVQTEFADELSDHCRGDGGPCECYIHDTLRDEAAALASVPADRDVQWQDAPCPRCGGSGYEPDGEHKSWRVDYCHACNGDGRARDILIGPEEVWREAKIWLAELEAQVEEADTRHGEAYEAPLQATRDVIYELRRVLAGAEEPVEKQTMEHARLPHWDENGMCLRPDACLACEELTRGGPVVEEVPERRLLNCHCPENFVRGAGYDRLCPVHGQPSGPSGETK